MPAETVRGLRIKVEISGTVDGVDGDKQVILFVYDKNFSDGGGADQVTRVWQDKSRALNNTSEDLDLGTGGLRDFQGDDLAMAGLKLIALQELGGISPLILKPGGTNPMPGPLAGTTPTLTVGENGLILLVNPTAAGWLVTDGSADRLAAQTSGDTTYQALLAGD